MAWHILEFPQENQGEVKFSPQENQGYAKFNVKMSKLENQEEVNSSTSLPYALNDK